MRPAVAVTVLALVAIACARTRPAAPAPAPTPVVATRPVGAPPGPGRRPPPNPMQQDTVRRAMVDSILATIRGREDEPAGTVFKNVTLLKDMPAGEFLRTMDTQYGRGLGWTCSNCHVAGRFEDDSRKNKKIARQMQRMQNYINGTALPRVKELDAEYEKTSCTMCHRGSAEPKGEPVPVPTSWTPPAPGRSGG